MKRVALQRDILIFMMSSGPVIWNSQRQRIITLSTTEAEYVAASMTVRESVWLRKLLKGIGCQYADTIKILIDNQSAIKLIKNPEFHKRTKHIDIRYNFIREKYESKEINVHYVPSKLQYADILTKPLCKDRLLKLRNYIHIVKLESDQTEEVLK